MPKHRKRRLNPDDSKDSDELASGSFDATVAEKLSSFLSQLENLDESTKIILNATVDPAIKSCLENLCALAKASSLLLQSVPIRVSEIQ
jgi:hypothetical protein